MTAPTSTTSTILKLDAGMVWAPNVPFCHVDSINHDRANGPLKTGDSLMPDPDLPGEWMRSTDFV